MDAAVDAIVRMIPSVMVLARRFANGLNRINEADGDGAAVGVQEGHVG
jgi:hypothetical protein